MQRSFRLALGLALTLVAMLGLGPGSAHAGRIKIAPKVRVKPHAMVDVPVHTRAHVPARTTLLSHGLTETQATRIIRKRTAVATRQTAVATGGSGTPAVDTRPHFDPGGEKPVRIRHYTSNSGRKGIEADGVIYSRDQGRIFADKGRGKPLPPRVAEETFGIKRGHANSYVEFDARPGEFVVVQNPITRAREIVFDDLPLMGQPAGNLNSTGLSLRGRNPVFRQNR